MSLLDNSHFLKADRTHFMMHHVYVLRSQARRLSIKHSGLIEPNFCLEKNSMRNGLSLNGGSFVRAEFFVSPVCKIKKLPFEIQGAACMKMQHPLDL